MLRRRRLGFPKDLPTGVPSNHSVGDLIDLQPGAVPKRMGMTRLSPAEMGELQKQLTTWVEKGWVVPSKSPWGSRLLVVPKPRSPGEWRVCYDARYLNSQTVNSWLPRREDLFDRLAGAKVISCLNMQQGYFQCGLTAAERKKERKTSLGDQRPSPGLGPPTTHGR
jgi:hypothetical protein